VAKGGGSAGRNNAGQRARVGSTIEIGGDFTPIIRGTVLSVSSQGIVIQPTNVRPGSFADRPSLIGRRTDFRVIG
jgi:hypothetical protein